MSNTEQLDKMDGPTVSGVGTSLRFAEMTIWGILLTPINPGQIENVILCMTLFHGALQVFFSCA